MGDESSNRFFESILVTRNTLLSEFIATPSRDCTHIRMQLHDPVTDFFLRDQGWCSGPEHFFIFLRINE